MQTIHETSWWDRNAKAWDVLPAGSEVPRVFDSELESFVDSGEAAALRDCAYRMRKAGLVVWYGRVLDFGSASGWRVRCFERGDFTDGTEAAEAQLASEVGV